MMGKRFINLFESTVRMLLVKWESISASVLLSTHFGLKQLIERNTKIGKKNGQK